MKKAGGSPPELSTCPELPDECLDAWQAFLMIGEATPTNIKAYCDLVGADLDAWEAEALLALERWRKVDKPWQQNTQV